MNLKNIPSMFFKLTIPGEGRQKINDLILIRQKFLLQLSFLTESNTFDPRHEINVQAFS